MNLKIALASRLALPLPSHSPPATSYSKKKVSFRLRESQKHEAVETYLARHRTRFFRLHCGATVLCCGLVVLIYFMNLFFELSVAPRIAAAAAPAARGQKVYKGGGLNSGSLSVTSG